MSNTKFVDIDELVSHNFEYETLLDNLMCAKCKLVLKDAFRLPCGCPFCRVCIEHMMTSGAECCPGVPNYCEESSLSLFSLENRTNESVSKRTVKYAHNGCVHECQLANIEDHLRECHRKNNKYPFCELGCKQDKAAAEEMNVNLQHDGCRYSEILIEIIFNINRQIEMIKQRDEDSRREIEVMKHIDEESRKEIEILRRLLVLKDKQISTMVDRLTHMEKEIKSISREKVHLTDRLGILSEKTEQEMVERHESDELDNVSRAIKYVDRETAVMTEDNGSDRNMLDKEMNSVKDDICFVKSQLQTIQTSVRYEWLIGEDLYRSYWYWESKMSEYFCGTINPYKYRLGSNNGRFIGTLASYGTAESLQIWLYIYDEPSDTQLEWPFQGRVTISIADRCKGETCKSISLFCRIKKPSVSRYSYSDKFEFVHSELKGAGLDLSSGVVVSCEIVPGAEP